MDSVSSQKSVLFEFAELAIDPSALLLDLVGEYTTSGAPVPATTPVAAPASLSVLQRLENDWPIVVVSIAAGVFLGWGFVTVFGVKTTIAAVGAAAL